MNLRVAIAVALFVALGFVGIQSARYGNTFAGDFRAFYCAGELARTHAFSYEEAAIARCEAEPAPRGFFTAGTGIPVLPAPLPGYAVAPFAVLSLLPFAQAGSVWLAFLALCSFAAVALLVRLRWTEADVAIVALTVLVAIIVLPVGELTPVALLGIALAAHGAQRHNRWLRLAGVALAFAEPQIALGMCSAAIGARRSAWREVATIVAGLAVLSILTVGPVNNVSYLRDFVPAHVATEVLRVQQYTVSWIAAELGAPVAAALWIGRIVFAAALALAAWTGARAGNEPYAIAAGAAIAVAGGPFVHLDHLVCAIPFALLLMNGRGWSPVFTLACIALPLAAIFAHLLLVFFAPAAIWLFAVRAGKPARAALYAAAGGAAVLVIVAALSARFGFVMHDAKGAGSTWGAYVAQHNIVSGVLIWIVKAPVWIGLWCLAYLAASTAAGGNGQRRRTA